MTRQPNFSFVQLKNASASKFNNSASISLMDKASEFESEMESIHFRPQEMEFEGRATNFGRLTDRSIGDLLSKSTIDVKKDDYDRLGTLMNGEIGRLLLVAASSRPTKEQHKLLRYDGEIKAIVGTNYPSPREMGFSVPRLVKEINSLTTVHKMHSVWEPNTGIQGAQMILHIEDHPVLGQPMGYGIDIFNSIYGGASLRINLTTLNLVCTNGATSRSPLTGVEIVHSSTANVAKGLIRLLSSSGNSDLNIVRQLESAAMVNGSRRLVREENIPSFHTQIAKAILGKTKINVANDRDTITQATQTKIDVDLGISKLVNGKSLTKSEGEQVKEIMVVDDTIPHDFLYTRYGLAAAISRLANLPTIGASRSRDLQILSQETMIAT
jgi:hypothetical protein